MLYLRKLLLSTWKPKVPIYLRKNIIISFQVLVFSFCISIFYIPVGILTHIEPIYQIAVTSTMISFFCGVLLSLKYYNFSRVCLIVYLNLIVFITSCYLGISFGIHIFFSPIFVLPLLIFDIKEKIKIQLSMLFTLLCIFFLVLSNFSISSKNLSTLGDLKEIENISTINFILSTITLGLSVSYLISLYSEKEKQLRISSVSLEESRINMQTLIDNIQDSIFSVDRHYRIIDKNKNFDSDFRNIYGHDLKKGDSVLSSVIPNNMNSAWLGFYRRVFRGETFVVEWDTSNYSFEISFSPIIVDGIIQAAAISSRNITQRKKTELSLTRSQKDLMALISSLDDIVFELENSGEILSVWTKDESVLFLPKQDFIGKPYSAVLPAGITERIDEGIEKLRHSEGTIIVEYYVEIQGMIRWFNAKLNPIKNEGVRSSRISVLVRDITEKKKTEAEIFQAKEIAEKAKLAESQFLSNMSHEIRTPLYAVIGLTDLLLKETHSEKVLEHLNIIKYSADNLLLIVNDILDFSKIESGSFSFDKLEFRISSLIQNLLKTVEITAKEKKLLLEQTIGDSVPTILVGDSLRLNQILLNLVSNAIKFTNSGFVKITVESESFSKNQVLVTFYISDSGIGIPAEEQKSIFQSFFQVKGTEKKYGGTGLGLAITKRLVEMQNGSISLKSNLGEGTTFIVKIPYEIGKEFSETNIGSDTKKNLSGIRVLIVDDFELNRIVGEEILSAWNISVVHAEDGKKALQILSTEEFDLILMDMQMPNMNGDEVASIIRDPNSNVKNHNVPIIALSADVFPETEKLALSAGINDFIRKPFIPDQLYESILNNLSQV